MIDAEHEAGPAEVRAEARRLRRAGRHDAAASLLEALLRTDPGEPEALAALALVRLLQGRSEEAERRARAVVAHHPGIVEAQVVLVRVAAAAGRPREAVEAAEAALRASPELPLWTTLGSLRLALGDAAGAAAAYGRALERQAGDVTAWLGLAEAERARGSRSRAAAALRRAVALAPENVEAWASLAAVLQRDGQLAEAASAYQRALALRPGLAAVRVNLARILLDLGHREAALTHADVAVALKPDEAAAHLQRGAACLAMGRLDEAEAAFRIACLLSPNDAAAAAALADLLTAKGDPAGAGRLLARALEGTPSLDLFLKARLILPVIIQSPAQIGAARRAYTAAIEEALAYPAALKDPQRLASSWFYLAYHGLDDRPIMERLAGLFAAKAPDLQAIAPSRPRRSGKIRVGFVSQFLADHTIGRLNEGFIARLDRDRFEVLVCHLPKTAQDGLRARISAAADRAIDLPPNLAGQRQALADLALDVILYTDVGMAVGTYLLAQARLAPVQVAAWGHPNTTGLPTVDYFLSSDCIEPAGAEAHYSERLVRLPRLAACYEPPAPPPRLDRAALGLPEQGRLYGCPQSLFKLHPDFDPVLAEIVVRDPEGWLVFLKGAQPAWARALRRRWAAYPGLNERAVFLPPFEPTRFLGLMAAFDVLLDPPHFGSGNTLYEAMALGVPVVTWPGGFARGRIVAGAYTQMGVAEPPVADSLASYAQAAVALASDAPRRGRLSAELGKSAKRELFCDEAAVASLSIFLQAAAAAAENGERLPSGWRPPAEAGP